jgi:hypothetical protein
MNTSKNPHLQDLLWTSCGFSKDGNDCAGEGHAFATESRKSSGTYQNLVPTRISRESGLTSNAHTALRVL